MKKIIINFALSAYLFLGETAVFADFGTRHLRASSYGTVASSYCSLSTNGRYSVFQSNSNSLIPSANNGNYQIFLFDRVLSSLEIVSRSSTPSNTISNGTCDRPVITGDGRYVAFESLANNLISSDVNSAKDIFIRDRLNSTLTVGSVSSTGIAGNGNSASADISSNGQYLAFLSVATNLASPCDNGRAHIFTKDRNSGAISCLSANGVTQGDLDSNAGAPAISRDGRYVVFGSYSSNLGVGGRSSRSDVYLWDRTNNQLELISRAVDGSPLASSIDAQAAGPGSITDDGRYVTFSTTGGGGPSQVYLRDRQSPGAVILLSSDTSGVAGNGYSRDPKIDSTGRYAVFYSDSDNLDLSAFLGGLFLKDRIANTIVALDTEAPPDTFPCISADSSTVDYSLLSANWDLYQIQQDTCPSDSSKEDPGLCGCGVVDNFTDSDSDGFANCIDACPNDSLKQAAGICGCGVSDDDTDSDGTANCNDTCPSDPLKQSVGLCGCGVLETDTDGDGTPNCNDTCPSEALKQSPGVCGCAVSDVDSDADGTADCNDACPLDSKKLIAGACGCGVSDTDSNTNGIADCLVQSDLRERISTVRAQVRTIKLATTAEKKKAMKLKVTKIKSLLANIKNLSRKEVKLVGKVNFTKQTDLTIKAVQKVYKYSDPLLKKNVKSAAAALTTLLSYVAVN